MKLHIKTLLIFLSFFFLSISSADNASVDVTDSKVLQHVNPMPDFIRVIDNSGDKLKLDEEQRTKLKQWQSERAPVEQKLIKEIMIAEADIHKAAVDDEELSKIDQLGDSILQNRLMLIRNKAFTREKIKAILTADQWKQLLEIYKASYKKIVG